MVKSDEVIKLIRKCSASSVLFLRFDGIYNVHTRISLS